MSSHAARQAAIKRAEDRARVEGDWTVWNDDGAVVGWMSWRQEYAAVPLVAVASSRDGRILANVLSAIEAKLPEGTALPREPIDADVVT